MVNCTCTNLLSDLMSFLSVRGANRLYYFSYHRDPILCKYPIILILFVQFKPITDAENFKQIMNHD